MVVNKMTQVKDLKNLKVLKNMEFNIKGPCIMYADDVTAQRHLTRFNKEDVRQTVTTCHTPRRQRPNTLLSVTNRTIISMTVFKGSLTNFDDHLWLN